MPKCICQICQCGKHRCPHYMTQPKSTKAKGPCQFSEYQTRYKGDASKIRDPIRKPDDQLKNEGQVDYNTTHSEKFPAHQIEKRNNERPQQMYVKNSAPMELSTEYGTKYHEGKGEHYPLPDYFKRKSQPYGDGKDRVKKSVTHKDFGEKQIGEKPHIHRLEDNVQMSEDPFDHQTTHQSDFTRLQQAKEPTHRRQDQLNHSGTGSYDTTNKDHYVQHKTGARHQKPPAAVYRPNERPFEGKSLMKSDYQQHTNRDKSEMIKYDNNLFMSKDPLDQETTNNSTYKSWEVQRRQVQDAGPTYRKPQGKMNFNKTSDDYKQHGSQAQVTKRPRDSLDWMDKRFNGMTSYKDGYITHEGHVPEKSMAREREYHQSEAPFDAVTESKDQYKRLNAAPSKPVKRDHEMMDRSAPFASDTSYDNHFNEKKLPECPSKAIVANNFAGYKFKDDFTLGHRYLVPDSARLGSPSAPLPPIGQQHKQSQGERYVAVH
eukprot:TCONS_00004478-protein